MSTTPIHVTTATFDDEVVQSRIPVVIDFWAPWCGPCKAIGPILDELSQDYAGVVKVAKVNVDEEPDLAGAFDVRSIPTLAVIESGEVSDLQVGFRGKEPLVQLFKDLAARSSGSTPAEA